MAVYGVARTSNTAVMMNNSHNYPRVSMVLISYNQERYIREAVASALAQDYVNLEIVISDDRSQDNTWAIINEIVGTYRGLHTIVLNRNEKNLGIVKNYQKAVSLTSGQWIVGLAGDDVALPDRVRMISHLVNSYPGAKAVTTGLIQISSAGNAQGYHFPTSGRMYFPGASAAYHRDCFERFGVPVEGVFSEDIVFPFRALLLGSLVFCDQPTVKYRIHADGIMHRTHVDHLGALKALLRTKANIILACEQRLRDLEQVRDTLDHSVFNAVKTRHEAVIASVEKGCCGIQSTVFVWESGVRRRIMYLAGSQVGCDIPKSLCTRAKHVLLAFGSIRRAYFAVQRRFRHRRRGNVSTPTGKAWTIELQDLLKPEIGPLIYL